MPALDENAFLHPWDVMADYVGPGPNIGLTIVIHRERGLLRFDVADCGNVPHPRVIDAIGYLRRLHAIAATNDPAAARDAPSFLFQTDDNPVDAPSASWETRQDWSSIVLVPDIYYYQALGYETFLPDIIPWGDRDDTLLWRGSTTGLLGLTVERLGELPRYRLCQIAADLGGSADCGFTGVVQGVTPEHDAAILVHLQKEGLMRDYIHTHDMQRARYAIDIDGNANSWNFIQRLRLGACMLRVESPWKQWFEPRLVPWEHYVPVKADLSDLVEKMDWCRQHEIAARDIAAAGRNFALRMSYDGELAAAGRILFA